MFQLNKWEEAPVEVVEEHQRVDGTPYDEALDFEEHFSSSAVFTEQQSQEHENRSN